jgi:hypothetical protein
MENILMGVGNFKSAFLGILTPALKGIVINTVTVHCRWWLSLTGGSFDSINDFEFGRLKAIRALRKDVRNYWVFPLTYARCRISRSDNLKHEIKVAFNGDGGIIHCRSANEMIFLLQSVALCDLLHSPVKNTALRLMSIREDVVSKLKGSFSADEISRSSTGGWPSVKEIALYLLIRKYRPSLVVETGVAQGISSRFILEAIRENGAGKLISIDLPNYNPEGYVYGDDIGTVDRTYVKKTLGTGWLVNESLRDNWQLILKPSRDALPEIREQADLFFHDSEHSYKNMMFEFEWARGHLSDGGFIVSDDIERNDAFQRFCEKYPGEFAIWSGKRYGVLRKMH